MANGKSVSNIEIYDRLERLRLEISKKIDETSRDHKSELADLRRQLETLEAGRLTRLEGKMTDFEIAQIKKDGDIQGSQKLIGLKFLILQTIAYVILFVVLQALSNKLFK